MYKMSEIMRNAEGYIDTTAGKAIKRTEQVHKGQVYDILKPSGSTMRVLVLPKSGRPDGTVMTATVFDNDNGTDIPVRYAGKTIMEGYVGFTNLWCTKCCELTNLIGEVDKESQKDIDSALGYYFGLKKEPEKEPEKPVAQTDMDVLIELAQLKKEAEIYKSLCEKLMGV